MTYITPTFLKNHIYVVKMSEDIACLAKTFLFYKNVCIDDYTQLQVNEGISKLTKILQSIEKELQQIDKLVNEVDEKSVMRKIYEQ